MKIIFPCKIIIILPGKPHRDDITIAIGDIFTLTNAACLYSSNIIFNNNILYNSY